MMATYNTGNAQLDTRLNYIADTFGITDLDPDRIAGWVDELATGSGRGRDINALWGDILEHVVGEERVRQLVESWFGGVGTTADYERITQELMNPGGDHRGFREVYQDIEQHRPGSAAALGTVGSTGQPQEGRDPHDPAAPVKGAGGVIQATGPKGGTGILQGGTLTEVVRPGQEPLLIYKYEYPQGSGSYLYVQFDDEDQATQILGEGFRQAPRYSYSRISEKQFEQGDYENIGNASQFAGMTGGFQNYITDVVQEAAQQAGVSDPTILGRMLEDPDMQRILVTGSLAGWSPERIQAEKRQTTFWTEVLYPGIEKFYGMTDNPEAAWAEYAGNIESALVTLGYQRDDDGSFRSATGELLEGGVEAQSFVGMVPTFLRAQQSEEYFQHLNQWSQRTLGKSIEFGDWFGVLEGEADPDLMLTAERATLSYIASQGGTGVSQAQIERLSNEADLSDPQAAQAFAEFDQALTALSGRALGRYGISRDDLFSLKTGLGAMSGRSHEEIRRKALQAATEEGLMDDQKASLYAGFTERGTVNRPGLQAARPMGA